MRKVEKYFETLLDELAENTYIMIPIIVGGILWLLWEFITQKADNYEEMYLLAYSIFAFIMGFSGILGFRKGVFFFKVFILKGVIAKVFNLILLICAWGFSILMLFGFIK
jgi:hypothetical protein